MSQSFKIPKGASYPSIVIKLEERDQYGNWINVPGLDGATVTFKMVEKCATVDQDSVLGQKIVYVTATEDFEVGDNVTIGIGTKREENGTVASVQAGESITLNANMTYDHTADKADDVDILKIDDVVGAVHDATEALVRYDWDTAAGDTDRLGLYQARFKATLTSGKIVKAPSRDRDKLFIEVGAEL